MAGDKIAIKDENIIFYELESNPDFDESALSEEERAKVEANHAAMEAKYKDRLLHLAFSQACPCLQQRVIERTMKRAALIQTQNPPQAQFMQEDADDHVFGIIASSTNGMYAEDMLCAVVWCQNCGSMKFYGDLRPLMRHLGNIYNQEADAMSIPVGRQEAKQPDVTPTFVMEDLETGEKTPADDLAKALFGAGAPEGSLSLESLENEAEGKSEE